MIALWSGRRRVVLATIPVATGSPCQHSRRDRLESVARLPPRRRFAPPDQVACRNRRRSPAGAAALAATPAVTGVKTSRTMPE